MVKKDFRVLIELLYEKPATEHFNSKWKIITSLMQPDYHGLQFQILLIYKKLKIIGLIFYRVVHGFKEIFIAIKSIFIKKSKIKYWIILE